MLDFYVYLTHVCFSWYQIDRGTKMITDTEMKLPAASGRGISGASLRIQSKIKQFELLHPGFGFFLIGALISDVISDCFL